MIWNQDKNMQYNPIKFKRNQSKLIIKTFCVYIYACKLAWLTSDDVIILELYENYGKSDYFIFYIAFI